MSACSILNCNVMNNLYDYVDNYSLAKYHNNIDFHFIHCMNFCGDGTNIHLGYVNIKSKEEFNTWFTEDSEYSKYMLEEW